MSTFGPKIQNCPNMTKTKILLLGALLVAIGINKFCGLIPKCQSEILKSDRQKFVDHMMRTKNPNRILLYNSS